MTVLPTTVEVYFDDVNPTDIGADLQEFRIDRGRASVFDEYQAGTGTVVVWNYGGTYLPDGWKTGGQSGIEPGKRVVVKVANGETIFDGFIDDWQYGFSGRERLASFTMSDALARAARRRLGAFTNVNGELTGARINTVLARPEVGWTGLTNIDPGNTTCAADPVAEGTNLLTYLQLVARTEWGRLYADRNGVLRFRDRRNRVTDLIIEFNDDCDGSGIEIQTVLFDQRTDLLFNQASITGAQPGAARQLVSDTASINAYDLRSVELDLLMNTNVQAAGYAEWIVGQYKDPKATIEGLQFAMNALDESDQRTIARLDFGESVTVAWTPEPGQTAPPGGQYAVDGFTWERSPQGGLTCQLRLTDTFSYVPSPFILDSATQGQLDIDRLTF